MLPAIVSHLAVCSGCAFPMETADYFRLDRALRLLGEQRCALVSFRAVFGLHDEDGGYEEERSILAFSCQGAISDFISSDPVSIAQNFAQRNYSLDQDVPVRITQPPEPPKISFSPDSTELDALVQMGREFLANEQAVSLAATTAQAPLKGVVRRV